MSKTNRSRCQAAAAAIIAVTLGACSSHPAPGKAQEVSVGYGTQDAATATGAVTSLRGEQLRGQQFTRVEQMIAARVPNTHVQQLANGRYLISMRGLTSVMGSNEPLFVVDGVALHSAAQLEMVQPSEVVRIDALRDAASAAIYGTRGANGVIIITTRSR